jgi:hypothetical protein
MMLSLLLTLLLGVQTSQPAPGLNPTWGAVLPEAAGAPLRRPRLCNRPMPWPIEGAWTPDGAVIAKLEVRLARALQAALDAAPAGRFPKPQVPAFYRQYFGFIVAGQRIVYINGVHEQVITRGRPQEWNTVAVNGCDGGLHLFGAEYDPAADTVHSVIFNGGGRGGSATPQH